MEVRAQVGPTRWCGGVDVGRGLRLRVRIDGVVGQLDTEHCRLDIDQCSLDVDQCGVDDVHADIDDQSDVDAQRDASGAVPWPHRR